MRPPVPDLRELRENLAEIYGLIRQQQRILFRTQAVAEAGFDFFPDAFGKLPKSPDCRLRFLQSQTINRTHLLNRFVKAQTTPIFFVKILLNVRA